ILAARGAMLFLVARNDQQLNAVASDLAVRGASRVEKYVLDVNDFDRHEPMLVAAEDFLGTIDVALIAHGTLGDQKACQQSADLTVRELTTNGVSVVVLL